MLHQDTVFLDLETTGGNAAWDRIIEIGLCEVADGELVREWSTLVNPERTIPPFIESYTGITDAMVQGAPVFADLRDDLLEALHGKLLVAHNARFDYGFLKNEFRRVNIAFQQKTLCTVKLSRRLYPHHRRHNLDALIERHGLDCAARHRALGDARVLWDFVRTLYRDLPFAAVDEAVRVQLKTPSVPINLPAENLENIPEGPGVYLFFGENDTPLYVGKSVNLRSRILSHFSGDHRTAKEMRISQSLRRIDWIETAGELGALLKENALVKKMLPIHNRRLRRSRALSTLVLRREGEFIRPEIVFLKDLGTWNPNGVYGIFPSPGEAGKTLYGLVADYGLCAKVLGLEKGRGPCFGYQLRKCRGACAGEEPPALHDARLGQALAGLKLRAWPYRGAIGIRELDPGAERTEIHVVDRWCHLRTVGSDAELFDFLESPPAIDFDMDGYRILTRYWERNRERLDIIQLPAPPRRGVG
jgi:DNA polymerase-3 subunit epsilon